MRNVPAIDSTGLHALRDLVRRSRRERTDVLLADVHAQPLFALVRSDLIDEIGERNLFANLNDGSTGRAPTSGCPRCPAGDYADGRARAGEPATGPAARGVITRPPPWGRPAP
jgi:hypothetical protein